jgi:hypothetical protein
MRLLALAVAGWQTGVECCKSRADPMATTLSGKAGIYLPRKIRPMKAPGT